MAQALPDLFLNVGGLVLVADIFLEVQVGEFISQLSLSRITFYI